MITDKGMHEIKKTNTRQEVERILPAEIFVTQFHAGCTAYFGILLFIKFVLLSFSQYLSSLMQRYITCICLYRRKSCRKVAVIFYISIFF